ncbi:MAG: hypothetical protein DMG89_20675 [Acidobacteria bacterium]|nr:MAG: hypothetical protein DMG89_20675 [Acidobacteriota bacterium]
MRTPGHRLITTFRVKKAGWELRKRRPSREPYSYAATLFFLLAITAVSLRPYLYSLYDMDMLGYMGNAVAMRGASIREIHDTVYADVLRSVPEATRAHLLGQDGQGPVSQIASRKDRFANAYHFAEFLPCFAIRPIFNELIYVLHYKLGIGLVRATIVIPVLSYWLLGIITFLWISRYSGHLLAVPLSLVLMLCPPLLGLARFNSPDALSCLFLMTGLFLILEQQNVSWGLVVVLSSIYVRTDNVLLVLVVLAYCAFSSRMLTKVQGLLLASVSVGSVLLINHFAGDYGMRVLYYRSFIEVPMAPGELVVDFGWKNYLSALRTAVSELANGYFFPFTFVGLLGLRSGSKRIALMAIVFAFFALHFLLFPSGQERFWGPYYLGMGITAIMSLPRKTCLDEETAGQEEDLLLELAV